MFTMNYIEEIFQRQGWAYKIDSDGDMLTYINSVPIFIILGRQGSVMLLTRVYGASKSGGAKVRAARIQTFLRVLNQDVRVGTFVFSEKHTGVVFAIVANLAGGPQDDVLLATALMFAAYAVEAISPLVASMMEGRLTLQQAIEMLNQALRDLQDRQRRRSA